MRQDCLLPLQPAVRARLLTKGAPGDRRFLAGIFQNIPPEIAPRALDEWEARLDAPGKLHSERRRASNLYALSLREDLLPELFPDSGLRFDASDSEITDAAGRAAQRVKDMLAQVQSENAARLYFDRIAGRYRVEQPQARTFAGCAARMSDPAWWRRALRKRFQAVEHAAIRFGAVHKRAAPYVSDEAMRRAEKHARRMERFLGDHEAVNLDTGEVATLTELNERSLANPENRRFAMMATVRALEAVANEQGCVGLFLTITCPSRMHARRASSGEANPAYDGTSPRRAQTYLARTWNAANSKLAREGIDAFGVRVVEPHHDATPHWHVLAFVAPEHAEALIGVLRDYALLDSPDEPGAAEHRFTVERIDPEKGSAAGYIAKYVSKNIDGKGVGDDEEAERPATKSVRRVTAWARLWGARQFQFFGIGALTPFRELRRLDSVPEALEPMLGDLWRAAKQERSDFAAYMKARDARGLRLSILYEAGQGSRYPDEESRRLCGIVVHGDAGAIPLETRPETWQIQRRPEAVEQRRGPVKPMRERVRSGVKHPSLGLDSITPRDIEMTGFFSASNKCDGLKNGVGRAEGRGELQAPGKRARRAKHGAHRGNFTPGREPLPSPGHHH
jgi:hypothetical protein